MCYLKLHISEECLFQKKMEDFSIVYALPSTHSDKKWKSCQILAKHNK